MRLVKPKKFLGQHFLKDLSIAQDIANTVDVCPELPILEVGPGMGVLTQFLLTKQRPVKVVELDFESVAYLKENFPSLQSFLSIPRWQPWWMPEGSSIWTILIWIRLYPRSLPSTRSWTAAEKRTDPIRTYIENHVQDISCGGRTGAFRAGDNFVFR